jgi:asparaginyl-tRNA synthetase
VSRVWIGELPGHIGAEVELAGWVYNYRSSGKIYFLQLRDGTGRVQAVCALDDVGEEQFAICRRLTLETSVRIRGDVRADPRAPGGVEITVRHIEIINVADEWPLQKKEHGVDFLLDHRHLWIRSSKPEAALKVRATVERAIADYFDNQGFTRVDAPILTGAAAEGSTTLFELDYFGTPAYLSQSGQLYNEATAAALGKVYCFGPTFRAEKSKTRRHVMEFWMVEPEVAFLDHEGNLRLAEGLIMAVIGAVLRDRRAELATLERDIAALERIRAPFPRVTYDEAIAKLQTLGFDVKWGDNYGADEENALVEGAEQPLVVEKFPRHVKAFYMQRCKHDPRLTYSMDILAPEGYGEVVGGSCREGNLNLLREAMREQEVPEESASWYLDLRRYGGVPTAGFGMGVCRTVAWMTGVKHIREVIPFPRMLNRLYP